MCVLLLSWQAQRVEKYGSRVGVLCMGDLQASHGPEGKELHEQSSAPMFPELGLFRNYCSMCVNHTLSVRTNGELLQNTMRQTRDSFSANYISFFFSFSFESKKDLPFSLGLIFPDGCQIAH